MAWVHRTKMTYVERSSPRNMESNYGLSFVDSQGGAIGNAEWIYNPDMSAVTGVPSKYWNIIGDVVSEMSQGEKDVIDAATLTAGRDVRIASMIDNLEGDLRQLVRLIISEINILRGQHGLPDRTMAQFKQQIRSGYGS